MKILHRLRHFFGVPGSKSPAPPAAAEHPWQRPADWPVFDPGQSANDIIFFGPRLHPSAHAPEIPFAPTVTATPDGSATAPAAAELPATMKEFMLGPTPKGLPAVNSAGPATKPRREKPPNARDYDRWNPFPGVIYVGVLLVGLFFGWHLGEYFGAKNAREEFTDRLVSADLLVRAARRNELLRDAERDRDRALWELARAEKEIAKHSAPAK